MFTDEQNVLDRPEKKKKTGQNCSVWDGQIFIIQFFEFSESSRSKRSKR